MQKKFQIFVSSTYQDLIEERRAVIEAILDLGHIPIGMEAFQASNEEQWSYIKKRIDEADYYVVIVAERYGSTNDQGVSFTEMEYDYAREKGVPVAAFLLHEDARSEWRSRKADFIDNRVRVDEFRRKCQGLMVKYWINCDTLAADCVKSISHMINTSPRDGWVPARNAVTADTMNELARLSKENDTLRLKINELTKFPMHNPHEAAERSLKYVMNYQIKIIRARLHNNMTDSYRKEIDVTDYFSYMNFNSSHALHSARFGLFTGINLDDIRSSMERQLIVQYREEIIKQYIGIEDSDTRYLSVSVPNLHEVCENLLYNGVLLVGKGKKCDNIWTYTEIGQIMASRIADSFSWPTQSNRATP